MDTYNCQRNRFIKYARIINFTNSWERWGGRTEKRREKREQLALNKERKNMGATRFQPIEKMRIETAVYIMHKRWVALKMSFKHRQETREYTDT